jgi:hypothetical protein
MYFFQVLLGYVAFAQTFSRDKKIDECPAA